MSEKRSSICAGKNVNFCGPQKNIKKAMPFVQPNGEKRRKHVKIVGPGHRLSTANRFSVQLRLHVHTYDHEAAIYNRERVKLFVTIT